MKTGLSGVLGPLIGSGVSDAIRLHGGCIGDVYRVRLQDGRTVVAKVGTGVSGLDVEGWMLTYLRTHSRLPVPEVLISRQDLLVMTFIPGESRFDDEAQAHAAELLADLHRVRGNAFGLERDTLIGGLPQPNPATPSWLEFFTNHRIGHMVRLGYEEGRISMAMRQRLERFCEQAERWLTEPDFPALLHGDVWTTNVLAHAGRITGFLDPAVYYGHPEIELSFTTLFGTFDVPFFRRYQEINPIPDGFFELRRDLYNLYPLLVHVRLFGSSYLSGIDRVLRRIGC